MILFVVYYLENTFAYIYKDPFWFNKNKTWCYVYDYGLDRSSEGYALEHYLK